MGNLNLPVISIGSGTAARTGTNAAGGVIGMPPMENGDLPKFVYCVLVGGTDTNYTLLQPKPTGVNGAVPLGIALQCRTSTPEILNVHGAAFLGHDTDGPFGVGGDGTSFLYVVPLEDF